MKKLMYLTLMATSAALGSSVQDAAKIINDTGALGFQISDISQLDKMSTGKEIALGTVFWQALSEKEEVVTNLCVNETIASLKMKSKGLPLNERLSIVESAEFVCTEPVMNNLRFIISMSKCGKYVDVNFAYDYLLCGIITHKDGVGTNRLFATINKMMDIKRDIEARLAISSPD